MSSTTIHIIIRFYPTSHIRLNTLSRVVRIPPEDLNASSQREHCVNSDANLNPPKQQQHHHLGAVLSHDFIGNDRRNRAQRQSSED